MRKQALLTIAKKEFFAFLNSPLSFVVIVPFLLLSTFLYFRTSFVTGEASLRVYFELLPWFLLLVAPALSMRLLTDENRFKTLELLFAHPISELEIALGKFLGALGFSLIILITTLGLPLSLARVGNPDWGIIISQYVGAALLGASFLALGMLTSAYVKNSIGSFLLAAFVSFGLILFSFDFFSGLAWPFGRILSELGVLTHMQNIARGFLDIRDLLYFLSLIALFIAGTVYKLSQRKIQENQKEKRKLRLAMELIIGVAVALNVFVSFYPLRIDLTSQKLFTLSAATKQTLKNLPDRVTITVYIYKNLPSQMQLTVKEINDLLSDFKRYGSRLTVKDVYPETDQQAASDATTAGIRQMSFNTVGTGKLEVQQGFLGLSIKYADKTESIPFIQDTSDLEYQLVRRIKKLTAEKTPVIGIYQSGNSSFNFVSQIIGTQYQTQNLDTQTLQDATKLKDYAAILLIDGGMTHDIASSSLKSYLDNGGKLLVLADGVSINQQSLAATKSESDIGPLLDEYGIKLNQDLAYDPNLNVILNFNVAGQGFATPYPFFLKALPVDENFSATKGLKSITLGWPSSLDIQEKSGISYKKLWQTGPSAGKLTDNLDVNPMDLQILPKPAGSKYTLAALAEKGSTRLAVIADSDFASDQMLQNFPENAAFFANMVDFMVTDKDVSSISKKVATRPVFTFTTESQKSWFQYGNIVIPPIIVAAFAFYWLSCRRKLTKRIYEN